MATLGGEGPYCITVLWTLSAIVLLFLVLRVYTRVVTLASYGLDDNLYVVTAILTITYSILATIACLHGFGRDDLQGADLADATFWRMLAQTFSLLATGTSKASVGFFLLRIVAAQWHKVVIWAVVDIMGILSLLGALFTFLGCRPVPYSWDIRVAGGSCIDTIPLSMALALGTIAADIMFVVLSWIIIWKLNSARKDKIVLAGSLSLGLFAAIAGAIRVMSVKGVRDVPVAVIVWSQVETCVTLICVGIPVCLPFWTIMWRKYRGETDIVEIHNPQKQDFRRDDPESGRKKKHGRHSIGLSTIATTNTVFSSKDDQAYDTTITTTTTTTSTSKSGPRSPAIDNRHSDEIKLTTEQYGYNGHMSRSNSIGHSTLTANEDHADIARRQCDTPDSQVRRNI